ncbi:MAG: glycosyltransferase family 4 protein [Sumerlaeia bacterium]
MTEQKTGESQPEPKKPKVLILCAVDFTVKQFLAPIARMLDKHGCEAHIACTPGPYWKELKESGLTMVPVRISRSALSPLHPFSALRLAWVILRGEYDVVHVHTPIAALLGRLVAWLCRRKVILHTAHGFYFHDRMAPWKRRIHIGLERLFAKFQDALICVSPEDARTAESERIERPENIHVIPNGVDEARFNLHRLQVRRPQVRQELGIPQDAPVMAIMGRMTREKGFFEFFRAAPLILKQVPNAHFLVIGDALKSERDRIRQKLEKLAKAPELQGRMHLLGMRDDVPELMVASDVFTLPSYREGMPVSIIEAMILSVPVVTTRIRGCREEVVDGSTGFLIDVGSHEELASAVSYLLRHREIAQKMGAAGRMRAIDEYSLALNLRRQWQLYERYLRVRQILPPEPYKEGGWA